jgi:hypothetical protein
MDSQMDPQAEIELLKQQLAELSERIWRGPREVAAIDYKGKRKRIAATDPGATHIHSRAELDSHADTCSFGDECLIVSLTGDVVNVSGFTDAIGGEMAKIPIATAALAY